MDPEKVKAVVDWPTPDTVRKVQAFLGLANYNRKYIKGYSELANPLTTLTKRDQPFHWGKKQEQAFQKLKQKFAEDAQLQMFDPEERVLVDTDASDFAIGAIIKQPNKDGKFRPVVYYSRKFMPAELNYDVHDKELLAIIDVCKKFKYYLQGTRYPVDVKSDHKTSRAS
jgi:hypothetical protein